MILSRHVTDRLAPLVDGELTSGEASRVNRHLGRCEACRTARHQVEIGAAAGGALPLVEAPPAIWSAIESSLDQAERGPRAWMPLVWLRPAFAALAVVAIAAAVTMWWRSDGGAAGVARLEPGGAEAAVTPGEWVTTDALSRTLLRIGTIGTVEVAPNTRMQVLVARPDEHRLNLARGTISAQIAAPPRLFFVETPSSTVVDLGCAYTMTVDETGAGALRVTGGWASLEWGGLESLVPQGASCSTRPGSGPGTPAFDDASPRLKGALAAFDFQDGGSAALEIVLAEARMRDTLTLWHLLSRVDAADRAGVFDRMVALGPLPDGVTREGVLALDQPTLLRWREELAWTW